VDVASEREQGFPSVEVGIVEHPLGELLHDPPELGAWREAELRHEIVPIDLEVATLATVLTRPELIETALFALDQGDTRPFEALLEPGARWLGVPDSDGEGGVAECHDPGEILGLLIRHHAHGRRFKAREFFERDRHVAVRLTVTDPRWAEAAERFKVFIFSPDVNLVVQVQDCVDHTDADAVLAGTQREVEQEA